MTMSQRVPFANARWPCLMDSVILAFCPEGDLYGNGHSPLVALQASNSIPAGHGTSALLHEFACSKARCMRCGDFPTDLAEHWSKCSAAAGDRLMLLWVPPELVSEVDGLLTKDREYARFRRRAAKESQAPGDHTKEQIEQLYVVQQGRCYYCYSDLRHPDTGRPSFHRDHMRSLTRHGTNSIVNIVLACAGCNSKKNHQTSALAMARRMSAGLSEADKLSLKQMREQVSRWKTKEIQAGRAAA